MNAQERYCNPEYEPRPIAECDECGEPSRPRPTPIWNVNAAFIDG